MEINFETIQEMRDNGQVYEAGLLLEQYHKQIKEERKSELAEEKIKRREDNLDTLKKIRVDKKKLGICINCDNVAIKGMTRCQRCTDYRKNWDKKQKEKNELQKN